MFSVSSEEFSSLTSNRKVCLRLKSVALSYGSYGPLERVTDNSVDGKNVALKGNSISRMEPNLVESQHAVIGDMISSELFKANKIAGVVGCSSRSAHAIKANIRCFGSTKGPSNGVGRPRSVTPPMLEALCERLLEKPGCWDENEICAQHRCPPLSANPQASVHISAVEVW
jgi:hypothetical protein